jgi:voltage-dependent potassium channel beta subunit
MHYRRLGRAGLKVSAISLGAWTTYGASVKDRDLVRDIVAKALELGVNYFDNADAYARGQGEAIMADVLEELDVPRHHLVLSTKLFWPMSDDVNDRGLSRKHILESIDRSLDRMRTDYVDLYFAHRYDPDTTLEETVEAFSDVVRSGRALYWGTSEWTATQIAEAHAFATGNGLVAPVVEQPQYSLLHRERVERDVLPLCTAKGIGLVTWSPLAYGMLTGKYDDGVPDGTRFAANEGFRNRFLTDANARAVKALRPIAESLGVSRAQLALAWCLRQPGVSSVITGATKVEQLVDNVAAADVVLDDDTVRRIDEAMAG